MSNVETRHSKAEHWTKLVRSMMETPAWRALSPVAQALYPWIRMEWKGPKANNNGKLIFSVRQAADALGVSRNTAAQGFHVLQAKGFLVVVRPAMLGVSGCATAPEYELTELPLWSADQQRGRRLYLDWRLGCDFPVAKSRTNNPQGNNGKIETHLKNHDDPVIEIRTFKREASLK